MAKSQSELANEFVVSLQAAAPHLTDTNEGSDIDILTQVTTTAVDELREISDANLRKTFFDTSNGSEITGDKDDLEILAVDRFGELFKRPGPTFSSGIVTFQRPSAVPGSVLIQKGTIVKTKKTSAGNALSFETEVDVILTGTSISVKAKALVEGPSSNALANTILEIESSLSDPSITVSNAQAFSGGNEKLNDAEYRIYIRNLIQTLKGGTVEAIQAKALTVAGVAYSKGIELLLTCREWSGVAAVGDVIKIPRLKLFVADANGTANGSMIDAVKTAIKSVRAGGVVCEVFGSTPLSLNWKGQVTLNPSGPNYASLQTDLSPIIDEMSNYINNLAIGSSFSKNAATAFILAKFGPTGTNDITQFYTLIPTADVAATSTDKFVAGTVSI